MQNAEKKVNLPFCYPNAKKPSASGELCPPALTLYLIRGSAPDLHYGFMFYTHHVTLLSRPPENLHVI